MKPLKSFLFLTYFLLFFKALRGNNKSMLQDEIQKALAKNKKYLNLGGVVFNIPFEEGEVKFGKSADEILKEMKKASKENLFIPRDDPSFSR